jgi:hypothetical protein
MTVDIGDNLLCLLLVIAVLAALVALVYIGRDKSDKS